MDTVLAHSWGNFCEGKMVDENEVLGGSNGKVLVGEE